MNPIAQDVRDLINNQHHMINELLNSVHNAAQYIYTSIQGLPGFIETFPPFPHDTRVRWYSREFTIGGLTEYMQEYRLDLTTIPGDHTAILIRSDPPRDTTQEDALPF